MLSALDSDSSGLGTKNFLSFQNGARIADSLSMGKVASTLAKGSWIDMGNFRGKYCDNLTHSVWKNINKKFMQVKANRRKHEVAGRKVACSRRSKSGERLSENCDVNE